VRALFAVLMLCMPWFAAPAAAADRFYLEAHAGFSTIQHSELAFRPIEAHFSAGAYFLENIGVDVSFATAAKEGEDGRFAMELNRLATLSLRFDSPPTDGLSAFVLLGFSQFEASQRAPDNPDKRSVTEDFQGGSVGIGLRSQLGRSPFSAVGVYRIHYVDQPIDIDSWTLGVRAAW